MGKIYLTCRIWGLFLICSVVFTSCLDEELPPQKMDDPEIVDPLEPTEYDLQRGYYDAPYKRYKAESGKCTGNATFLPPSDYIPDVQSEASNNIAASLINPGDYVEWTCQEAADGMVIRFSIPDAPQGGGTKGTIALFVDGEKVTDIELDSYWAWQYKEKVVGDGNWYFDNTPGAEKYARMRFDELRVKLDEMIPAGSHFRLQKVDDNTIPYTIDFVELEPVPAPRSYESLLGAVIKYDAEKDGDLNDFISMHAGKTIYLPPGKYDVKRKIWIPSENTNLIGAGSWHTELYFSAAPASGSQRWERGIWSDHTTTIEGIFMNTSNERRYFDYHGGIPMGKGLEGTFGKGSVINDVWIEHFECGAWLNGVQEMQITHCRMRNNYADGINLCGESSHCVVEHSNFRSNGDDNVATWSSASTAPAEYITFKYCTSELSWRAGGFGVFGGKGHKLLNLIIQDQCESGMRIISGFPGAGFSEEDYIVVDNVSIYNSGVKSGNIGDYGDIGGNAAGAFDLGSHETSPMYNIKISNTDIYNSRWDAMIISSKINRMTDVYLQNVTIDGWKHLGIGFDSPMGKVFYQNLIFRGGNEGTELGQYGVGFRFIPY